MKKTYAISVTSILTQKLRKPSSQPCQIPRQFFNHGGRRNIEYGDRIVALTAEFGVFCADFGSLRSKLVSFGFFHDSNEEDF